MKTLALALCIAASLIFSTNVNASLSFNDEINWKNDGSTYVDGENITFRDGIELSGKDGGDYDDIVGDGKFTFTYLHEITFHPYAASIESATVTLSHLGNSNNNGEVWLFYGDTSTLIGTLSNSTNANDWKDQDFTVSNELLTGISGESWSLMLKLEENTSGTDKLTIDKSVLHGSYSPVPIPGAIWLLTSSLLCVAGLRKRRV